MLPSFYPSCLWPRRELGTLTKTLGGGGGNEKRRARLAAKRDRLASEVAQAEATLQRLVDSANTRASSIAAAAAAAMDAADAADVVPASFEEAVQALAPAEALLPHSRRERTAERAAHSEALRRRLCVWQQAPVTASRPEGDDEEGERRVTVAAEACIEAMTNVEK